MATNTITSDGRQSQRIEKYTKHWNNDLKKEHEGNAQERIDNYKELVNGYYDGATELYEYGWSQSFHFCRFNKGEAFQAALARYEHNLSAKMNLRPGMKVLDVGSGVGGPAREIARFADVEIIGINNNEFQIGRARRYVAQDGLEKQVTFVNGDFMKLVEHFGENYFDAVYGFESTCHAPSVGVFGEIFKVLKPGGVFGMYEWCMTEDWDPSIPEHKELAHRIELGDGIPEMRSIQQVRQALEHVGFATEYSEDLAKRPDVVPWYYPLEGDLSKAQTTWDLVTVARMSEPGKFITSTAIRIMEYLRLLPKGTFEVAESLRVAGEALVEGGRKKLFTPMFISISRKPAN